MPNENTCYIAIAETLHGIYATGHAILPQHPSQKLLNAIAATTHITPAQAMSAYRMIHQLAIAEFSNVTDPLSFRQKLLMSHKAAS